jgi:hypothetical protein
MKPSRGMAELLSRDYLISRDDLRTRSKAASAAFRKGGRGGTAGERREDGADDHSTHRKGKLGVCVRTVSTRRSRIKRTASGRREEEDAACRERIWNATCTEL